MPIVEGSARPSAACRRVSIRTDPMAHGGHSPSLRWPIRWRLPLLICGLLLATVAAFASVAYWYLEQALLDATHQRLQNVAPSDGDACCRPRRSSASRRRAGSRRRPKSPHCSPRPTPGLPASATAAPRRTVNAFLKSSPQTVGVEVWRSIRRAADYFRSGTSDQAGHAAAAAPPGTADRGRRDAAGGGQRPGLLRGDGRGARRIGRRPARRVVFGDVGSVRPPGGRRGDDVSARATVASGPISQASSRSRRSSRARTPSPTTKTRLACVSSAPRVAIQGTPWLIWVSMPRSIALGAGQHVRRQHAAARACWSR